MFIYSAVYSIKIVLYYTVLNYNSGMVCSIILLFGMLVLVFFSILIFNWKMTKGELFLSSFPFSSSTGK
jgi:hypothetical protein